MERTIAAISTPPGPGGIAVIRMSGDKAVEIGDKIFRGGKKLADASSHTVHYGFIVNGKNEKIDEVLVTVMRAPKTFTREDVVEISAHGGAMSARSVLDAAIRAGASPAEPGEFTKRAFLNGRIDLSQAEAVIDIINSKNELSRRSALSQLEGGLSKEIKKIRGELVRLAAGMQVIIDYPDEELEDVTERDIYDITSACARSVKKLLDTADSGRLIRDGLRVAIVGKPNVGKSSLLNSLARAERAIVTDVAGTTRDVIEEYTDLGGVPVILTDTAGIRETDDIVEKIGVERSQKSIDECDLAVVMLDGSTLLTDEDMEILRMTAEKQRIIVINKTDLCKPKYAEAIKSKSHGAAVLETSAVTGIGLDELTDEIKKLYHFGSVAAGSGAVITNMRHKKALMAAGEALNRASDAVKSGLPTDMASLDINEAINALGEITGETVSDSIVDEIFHSFCVGK